VNTPLRAESTPSIDVHEYEAALALRQRTGQRTADAPLWLSAVVLEELYAGASDRERRAVERLKRDFDRAKRILVPNLSDWTLTGRVLARLAAKYVMSKSGRGGSPTMR
jgi:predicted nucleic acid-binding protein